MVKGKDKLFSIISYLLVLIGIIWYFVDKKAQNSFNKNHLKQAINIYIIAILLIIAISISSIILPNFITSPLNYIVRIGILILIGLQIFRVIVSSTSEAPIIGGFAKKYLTF